MVYEYLYFFRGSLEPVRERRTCPGDGPARARAAEELLRIPSRTGVDVWCGERIVYSRRRARASEGRSPAA
ncbi:MAG: hypothetical protein A2623_07660 [Caulobacterales bacterium RIFCSPHIGHO2_01_FULL_70_19]|nr:MAG: hypothetical protein A2623_07660 [Caulobacterales bacterium RIFCSPHIGHO2_01_FULL_70_19]